MNRQLLKLKYSFISIITVPNIHGLKINIQSKLRIHGYSLKIILLVPLAANWKGFGNWNNLLLIYFFTLTQELSPIPRLITDRDLNLPCSFTLVVMEMKNQSLTARLTRILVHVPMMRLLVLYVLKVSCIHSTKPNNTFSIL